MKIALCLGRYEGGGFTTVVTFLAKELVKKGLDVQVVAYKAKVPSLEQIDLQVLRPKDFSSLAKRYDVIHIHNTYPFLKELVKRKFENIIFTYHGDPPLLWVPGIKGKASILYTRLMYRFLLNKVNKITAVSYYAKDQLQKLYGIDERKVEVVYNGVDTDLFKPCRDNGTKYNGFPVVLNLTAYEMLKGVDILFKYFKKIQETYPEAILITKTPEELAKSYSKRYKISMRKVVILTEFLSYETLPRVYCSADFLLMSSRWESFGLPLLEALACGVPVVAYKRDDARVELMNKFNLTQLLFTGLKDIEDATDKALKMRKSFPSSVFDIIAREFT